MNSSTHIYFVNNLVVFRVDPNAKVTYTVYNRIGMLLKSLVSVTRVTPAYQLSRKQGTDFMMCYK